MTADEAVDAVLAELACSRTATGAPSEVLGWIAARFGLERPIFRALRGRVLWGVRVDPAAFADGVFSAREGRRPCGTLVIDASTRGRLLRAAADLAGTLRRRPSLTSLSRELSR